MSLFYFPGGSLRKPPKAEPKVEPKKRTNGNGKPKPKETPPPKTKKSDPYYAMETENLEVLLIKIYSEWVIIVWPQMRNFSVISWREQVTLDEMIMMMTKCALY